MTVSVIVPYIETTDHILKTADSIKNQKKLRQGDVDLLVVDITPDQTASQKLSGYSYAKVISAPEAENEAQAYNLALKELTADYAIFARPGDVFGSDFSKRTGMRFESAASRVNVAGFIYFVSGTTIAL